MVRHLPIPIHLLIILLILTTNNILPPFFVALSATPFLVFYLIAIQSNQNFFNIISILLAFPHPSCYNIFNNNLILLEMESAIKGSD